jgi:hypothetical protein
VVKVFIRHQLIWIKQDKVIMVETQGRAEDTLLQGEVVLEQPAET